MTTLDTTLVDRRLGDVTDAYDALTGMDSWVDERSIRRLRRVLYPVYRVEYAYQTPDGRARDVVVLDGRGEDRHGDLARYRQTIREPEPIDEMRLDRGTTDDPGTTMALSFEAAGDAASAGFEDLVENWRARRQRTNRDESSDDDTGRDPSVDEVGAALRERLGLPDAFDPDTFVDVTTVDQVYLPFWCVEYTTDGTDEAWLLGIRPTDRGPVRHPWIAHLVVSEFADAFRSVPPLPTENDPTAPPGDEPTGGEPGDDEPTGNEPAGDEPTGNEPAGDGRSRGQPEHADASGEATADEPVVDTPEDVGDAAAAAFDAPPDRDFGDVGGMHDLVDELQTGVLAPLAAPEQYDRYGLGAVNGVLLHGPPGCGKTYIAKALAGELDRVFGAVTPADLTSKWVGEAAENVADLFAVARENQPCVVFIDELDAVAGDRDRQMTNTEQQMVNQLLVELEDAAEHDVVVVAATNHVADVDGAIRRSGRFDKRIEVGPPDADARREIIQIHLRGRPTTDDLDLGPVVRQTAGFAGSDLTLLVEDAARAALDADEPISTAHLETASRDLDTSIPGWLDDFDVETPPARAGELTVPGDITLDAETVVETAVSRDFGRVPGMQDTLRELDDRVVHPVTRADVYADHGIPALDGAILFGPPGCGKSYVARAVAGELDVPFVPVTPSALVTEWPGSPDENVTDAFALAKANAPAVLFLDDLDTLVPDDHGRGTAAERRLHNQLAMELRAIVDTDVLVLGATHLLDDVDDAILHAAAFDERVEVPPPTTATRAAVLEASIDDDLVATSVDWRDIARDASAYAIADLRLAAENAARGALRENEPVTAVRLRDAITATPSTLANWPDRERYSDSDHGSTLRYID